MTEVDFLQTVDSVIIYFLNSVSDQIPVNIACVLQVSVDATKWVASLFLSSLIFIGWLGCHGFYHSNFDFHEARGNSVNVCSSASFLSLLHLYNVKNCLL